MLLSMTIKNYANDALFYVKKTRKAIDNGDITLARAIWPIALNSAENAKLDEFEKGFPEITHALSSNYK